MARPLDVVLDELLDYTNQAISDVGETTFQQYFADQKTQRAVERCIEVISEASRHIPRKIKSKHPEIPWADVAAIGNVFRHEYHNIAARIVYDTVSLHLPQLEAAARSIKAELPAPDEKGS